MRGIREDLCDGIAQNCKRISSIRNHTSEDELNHDA